MHEDVVAGLDPHARRVADFGVGVQREVGQREAVAADDAELPVPVARPAQDGAAEAGAADRQAREADLHDGADRVHAGPQPDVDVLTWVIGRPHARPADRRLQRLQRAEPAARPRVVS